MRTLPGINLLISSIMDCQSKHRLSFSLLSKKNYVSFIRFIADLGIITGYQLTLSRLYIFVRYCPDGEPLLQYAEKPALNGRQISFRLSLAYPFSRPFKVMVVSTSKGFLLQSTAYFLRLGGRSMFNCA